MIGNKDFNKMFNEALKQLEKKTNADRIRSMSDEELADWNIELSGCGKLCPALKAGCAYTDQNCKDAWLEWLKQEIE